MNINRIDYKKPLYNTSSDKHMKEEDIQLHGKDTVILSGSVPVTLDFAGKSVEKKIACDMSDKEITLHMKHTNDVHGNMPSVAAMIKPDEFWVDAGDAWQDYTFHSIVSGGMEEAELMNLRGCDIAVPGNHLYDDGGVSSAEKIMENSDFPYISSNIKGMAPYVIAEVEGIKLAFIGTRTPRKRFGMVDPSLVKDLDITDPVEALRKSVDEVRSKGIKNVIVISHLGLEPTEEHKDIISDKEVAQKIPGIDLIIGGHTHTPTKDNVTVNGTRIVQAGPGGHGDPGTDELYIGDLSMTFDRNTGKITSINHNLLSVDRDSISDKDVNDIHSKYVEEEKRILQEKLGIAEGDLTHEIKTPVDSSLGNLITDAMRRETGADIAMMDSNFFFEDGHDMKPNLLPEGEITMKNLTEVSPWIGSSQDTRVETWPVKGEDIKKLLEDGVTRLLGPKKHHGLFQVSGLSMSYDPAEHEGARVKQVMVGDKPLDMNKNYNLTTSFYVGNWNSIFSGRDENTVTDGRKLRAIVADYIKDEASISPVQDGRIKIL
ncbi:MAG: 5'-nucleotidase C-terminal domain-containing protein [Candidatus Eremiobacterota bacterium]